MLGRIIDAPARRSRAGSARGREHVKLLGQTINPLSRNPIDPPLDVGVRSINALLTVGRGQRSACSQAPASEIRLFGMMARYTSADVIVVGLIGERRREVKEFVDRILGPEGRRRAVVVAYPADNPPACMRLHGAWLATSVAEYFRDRGHNVLLIMDSLTRFAQAQREIGLAIGEAPATKGYPPSVFARMPALVERAGNGATG